MTLLALRFRGRTEATNSDGFEMVIPNDKTQILAVNKRFDEQADRWDVSQRIRNQVPMAFDELLANVIEYGYDDGTRHEIRVTVTRTPDRLKVTLIDDGRPFDPFATATPDLTLDAEDRGIGGLGIHLCREVFDRVAYERRAESNILTLELALDVEPSRAS
jgi:anti-sigma regulatory factor (Ser/Thr protein kinase)